MSSRNFHLKLRLSNWLDYQFRVVTVGFDCCINTILGHALTAKEEKHGVHSGQSPMTTYIFDRIGQNRHTAFTQIKSFTLFITAVLYFSINILGSEKKERDQVDSRACWTMWKMCMTNIVKSVSARCNATQKPSFPLSFMSKLICIVEYSSNQALVVFLFKYLECVRRDVSSTRRISGSKTPTRHVEAKRFSWWEILSIVLFERKPRRETLISNKERLTWSIH